MQDLISYQTKTDIKSNIKTQKKAVSDIIQALNKVSAHFPMENEETKKKYLSNMIYRIELLEVKQGDLVLELGADCGLQAAVLTEMGAKVIAVCADKSELLHSIEKLSTESKNRIEVYGQDQIVDAGSKAPFDKMIIAPEVSNIPVEFYGLLSINGDMVITGDASDDPTILHVQRTGQAQFDTKKKTRLVDHSASYDVFDL